MNPTLVLLEQIPQGPHRHLEAALMLATLVHTGQIDKAGQPYILHPIRLMQQMTTDEARQVALLHDVLEDTVDPVSVRDALDFFSREVRVNVLLLTRPPEPMDYIHDYIEPLLPSDVARTVKIADLYDNLDPRRMPVTTEKDLNRVRRYHQALEVLQ